MIDHERVVRDFANKIFRVQPQEMHIGREDVYAYGVLAKGIGWHVPRLAGLRGVDWGKFIAALTAARYDCVISIEHEDRNLEGDEDLLKCAFYLARDVLKPDIQ